MSELRRITDIKLMAERYAEAGYDVESNPYSTIINPNEHRLFRHYFFQHQTAIEQQKRMAAA